MFIIEIKRRYKYNYIITKNRIQIARFDTKKQARDYLFKLSNTFRELNKQQRIMSFHPILLRSGESMSLFTEMRSSLEDPFPYETKDYYAIRRIINN